MPIAETVLRTLRPICRAMGIVTDAYRLVAPETPVRQLDEP